MPVTPLPWRGCRDPGATLCLDSNFSIARVAVRREALPSLGECGRTLRAAAVPRAGRRPLARRPPSGGGRRTGAAPGLSAVCAAAGGSPARPAGAGRHRQRGRVQGLRRGDGRWRDGGASDPGRSARARKMLPYAATPTTCASCGTVVSTAGSEASAGAIRDSARVSSGLMVFQAEVPEEQQRRRTRPPGRPRAWCTRYRDSRPPAGRRRRRSSVDATGGQLLPGEAAGGDAEGQRGEGQTGAGRGLAEPRRQMLGKREEDALSLGHPKNSAAAPHTRSVSAAPGRGTSGAPPRGATPARPARTPDIGAAATRQSAVQSGQCCSWPRTSGTTSSSSAAVSVTRPGRSRPLADRGVRRASSRTAATSSASRRAR